MAFSVPFLVGLPVASAGVQSARRWSVVAGYPGHGRRAAPFTATCFSIYGPARYLLLVPFFLVLGKSALTLAIFKAVLDGTASALSVSGTPAGWAPGRWAWLVPLGVIALGPSLSALSGGGRFCRPGRVAPGCPDRSADRAWCWVWPGVGSVCSAWTWRVMARSSWWGVAGVPRQVTRGDIGRPAIAG